MSRDMTRKARLMIVFLFSLTIISSCKEPEDVLITSDDLGAYESEENLERAFTTLTAITNAAIEYAEGQTAGRTMASQEFGCATIDFEGTKEMGKIEINYGEQGCQGPDGRIRKGKLIVEYSGKQEFYGSAVYTVPSNFYLDGYKVEGTLKSENISTDPEKPKFSVKVINGKLFWPDQTYFTWQCDRIHAWTFDAGSQNITVSITGSSYGRTRTAEEFATEILEPLIVKSTCVATGNYFPVKGVKKMTLYPDREFLVDYGAGVCDKEITLTFANETKDVYL